MSRVLQSNVGIKTKFYSKIGRQKCNHRKKMSKWSGEAKPARLITIHSFWWCLFLMKMLLPSLNESLLKHDKNISKPAPTWKLKAERKSIKFSRKSQLSRKSQGTVCTKMIAMNYRGKVFLSFIYKSFPSASLLNIKIAMAINGNKKNYFQKAGLVQRPHGKFHCKSWRKPYGFSSQEKFSQTPNFFFSPRMPLLHLRKLKSLWIITDTVTKDGLDCPLLKSCWICKQNFNLAFLGEKNTRNIDWDVERAFNKSYSLIRRSRVSEVIKVSFYVFF